MKFLTSITIMSNFDDAYTIRFKTNFINLMNFTNAFRLTVRLHSHCVEIRVLQAISACQISTSINFNTAN